MAYNKPLSWLNFRQNQTTQRRLFRFSSHLDEPEMIRSKKRQHEIMQNQTQL